MAGTLLSALDWLGLVEAAARLLWFGLDLEEQERYREREDEFNGRNEVVLRQCMSLLPIDEGLGAILIETTPCLYEIHLHIVLLFCLLIHIFIRLVTIPPKQVLFLFVYTGISPYAGN